MIQLLQLCPERCPLRRCVIIAFDQFAIQPRKHMSFVLFVPKHVCFCQRLSINSFIHSMQTCEAEGPSFAARCCLPLFVLLGQAGPIRDVVRLRELAISPVFQTLHILPRIRAFLPRDLGKTLASGIQFPLTRPVTPQNVPAEVGHNKHHILFAAAIGAASSQTALWLLHDLEQRIRPRWGRGLAPVHPLRSNARRRDLGRDVRPCNISMHVRLRARGRERSAQQLRLALPRSAPLSRRRAAHRTMQRRC